MAVSALYDDDYVQGKDLRNPGHGFVHSVVSASAKEGGNTIDLGDVVNTIVDDPTDDARLAQEGLNESVDVRVTFTQAAG